jgi:hypothetical protein
MLREEWGRLKRERILGHEPPGNTKEPGNTFLSLQTRFVYFLWSF